MKRIVPIVVALIFLMPSFALAHSGGTDANGGHHDYNNVSGLGSYHYHHGYGPHLHEGGVCPYEGGSSSSATYSNTYDSYSDEEQTFTTSELMDYTYEVVHVNPELYDVVPVDEYEELQSKYTLLKENSIDSDEATTNVFIAIGVTGAIGILACYLMYRKYNK